MQYNKHTGCAIYCVYFYSGNKHSFCFLYKTFNKIYIVFYKNLKAYLDTLFSFSVVLFVLCSETPEISQNSLRMIHSSSSELSAYIVSIENFSNIRTSSLYLETLSVRQSDPALR
ncbi:hypothetical protein NEPAR04_1263 [Nematocida parisii]|nr:hypothetical protein NEPAR08_1291 [Nematocida parisii]KAI5128582.1 hypothetical protein NEPAR03_1389 [Nematocida parisii]KAI5141880.1 hypothetical protein NEPAR04_1263 [Nematocida parisii]